MSKSCGVTGALHALVRKDTKTASGEKSLAEDVYPNPDTNVFYEVNDGTKKKPVWRKVQYAVLNLVRQFVIADNNAKAAKEQADEAAEGLRVFIREFRGIRHENTGRYQGSYRVNGEVKGKTQYAVQVNAQDRFSMPKKDKDVDALREIVGKEFFGKFFERVLNISIRKEVLEDRKLRRALTDKLIEAFGEDGLKEWFVKEEVWSVKKGLDEGIFELDPEKREEFLEACPQYADQVKNACYNPKDA